MQPSLAAATLCSVAAAMLLCVSMYSVTDHTSALVQTSFYLPMHQVQMLSSSTVPNMEVKYDPATGVFTARNPETGAVTKIDTASGSVDTVADFEKKHFQFEDEDSDVLTPVNSGDPHTYFPGWKQSPSTTHGRLDGVTESPRSADFRRHYSNFLRYLGSDGEDPEEAAIRIYNLYPSGASALDGDQEA
ncbi:hypothetical protein GUITHDRAFT_152987 [Guillardia theta CCMP2712]|uniref:Uncharacterized protein n=2 Tax=Guillardia theta TaxID=55529 RepID=L1J7K7_GUITC|nr:hypothetical protein GUITHDRAFT_152987 [Guillardia theta CCMP2712]EKX44528.1 hypothetical protein GUITHDRAFT_152987 [Guillardia theta CCMP2712]|eukprot:XP_005831508.1 hypothetical protein GUITHDRAFT_152987 [Guillardia theta CCMP2712]